MPGAMLVCCVGFTSEIKDTVIPNIVGGMLVV